MKYMVFFISIFSVNLTLAQKAKKEHVSKQPYFKFSLFNKINNDSITFYLSEFKQSSYLPLIIYVQGSGNNSLFAKDSSGRVLPRSGHISWTLDAKDKAKVLIVEKPGVRFLEQTLNNTEFDKKFSLETWSKQIENAIAYVVANEKIDTSRVLIVGHSEGGIVAARVAKNMASLISHTAILAGEGPSQLYSLYKFTEAGEFFYANGKSEIDRMDSLQKTWQKILTEPSATDKKFWGFTYLRWSSFLKTSVMEELNNYNGKILILQGDADRNVHPESAKILYIDLLSKGKSATLELIPNADHSFNISNSSNINGWQEIIKRCIDFAIRK
jgi:dienelactone hydrolase